VSGIHGSTVSVFSNRNLAIIALVLIIGAAGDGLLYNRPDTNVTIYPLQDPQSIEVRYQDEVVIALRKFNDRWLVTAPFHAPARYSRVALLLDSNNQIARSYTQDVLQSATDDNFKQIFTDAVELRVDGNLFLLGLIEPVSQLRYVAANNKVYLHADHIVPLLQSPASTFTDLNITLSVESVDIQFPAKSASTGNDRGKDGVESAVQLSEWNDLEALTVINANLIKQPLMATATVYKSADSSTRFDIFPFQQHVALHPQKSEFAYLITEQRAEQLGICVYC